MHQSKESQDRHTVKKDAHDRQILEKLLADPELGRRLLECPAKTIGDITGKRIREATIAPDKRQVLETLLAHAARDASFRERVAREPEKVLAECGYVPSREAKPGIDGLDRPAVRECHLWSVIDYIEW